MNYTQFQKRVPNVSRETFDNFALYVELVIEYNQKLNLIGKSTENDIWERHIIDSAQLLNFVNIENDTLYDVGSGAGLPGIILSIAGVKLTYLIESKQKKTDFLHMASKFSPNEIVIINERVENLTPIKDSVFVCRAFAPLNKIFSLCSNHIISSKKTIIPKGQNYLDEIAIARKDWSFNFSEHKTITSGESRILIITNLTKCKK
ncbi:MAG: 16S rRNA (guanine(527)-N(7))-methyltransferase RsmG [Rickettsiales bacterium]|jgi:16S rRNA (guanine527-N7)-methyltransferase|nr:16S rRNA (guanine(527)-N(7))-methyltransferase RsmG [Rickettsiales bacterium]